MNDADKQAWLSENEEKKIVHDSLKENPIDIIVNIIFLVIIAIPVIYLIIAFPLYTIIFLLIIICIGLFQ